MQGHFLSAALLLAPLPVAAEQNWLVGSWTLASSLQTDNGQTKDYFGPHPLGQLIFGPDGRFANVTLRADLGSGCGIWRRESCADISADQIERQERIMSDMMSLEG
jgi:hypothetical protein